jgi:hypothetical protein
MEVALAKAGRSNTVMRVISRGKVMAGDFIWFWVLKNLLGYKAKFQGGVAGVKTVLKSSV